jgi:hypothetical protein
VQVRHSTPGVEACGRFVVGIASSGGSRGEADLDGRKDRNAPAEAFDPMHASARFGWRKESDHGQPADSQHAALFVQGCLELISNVFDFHGNRTVETKMARLHSGDLSGEVDKYGP